jgi:hypothetical protein
VVWFDVRSVCGRSEGVPMFLGRWIFVRVFVPEPFFFFVCVCVCVCVSVLACGAFVMPQERFWRF